MSTGLDAMDILTRFAPEMTEADLQTMGACSLLSQEKLKPNIQRLCATSEIMLAKRTKIKGSQLRVLAMTSVIHCLIRTIQGMLRVLMQENFAAATLLRKEILDILENDR